MNNPENDKLPNGETDAEFADVYARYKIGMHEVSFGIRTGNDLRFILSIAFVSLTFAATVLLVLGHVYVAAMVFAIQFLGAVGATLLVMQRNGKNCQEPANKPIDSRVSSISED